jgi:hypothetical protein
VDRGVPEYREMRYVVSIALVLVAFIHLMPVTGALGAARLQALYGIAVDDPGVLLLLRHRAVLFGLLGGVMLAAACIRTLQPLALLLGFASVISFLWMARDPGAHTAGIAQVVSADWIALILLCVGTGAYVFERMRS